MALIGADPAARVRLAALPTPLIRAPRLAQVVGAGTLYVKRDDLTGFAFAGNKARPLEFLVAAALGAGADTLVTGGAPGSNFCAAVAAAAARAGLRCELVMAGHPGPRGPALALARSWGAAVRWTGVPERDSVDAGLPVAAAELAADGRRPYLMPRGGASGLGAVGYALAAFELREQLASYGADSARVVVAAGLRRHPGRPGGRQRAGGPATDAGGRGGQPACGRDGPAGAGPGPGLPAPAGRIREPGIPGPDGIGPASGAEVRPASGAEMGRHPGPRWGLYSGAEVRPDDVVVADARGPGHGLVSPEATAAAEHAMRTEGLMVDPVYTAKALALVSRYAAGGNVVFWHTGGQLDVVALAEEAGR